MKINSILCRLISFLFFRQLYICSIYTKMFIFFIFTLFFNQKIIGHIQGELNQEKWQSTFVPLINKRVNANRMINAGALMNPEVIVTFEARFAGRFSY